MQTASSTLKSAITAAVRSPIYTAKVDFGRDGYSGTDDISQYVQSISITRSLTTDVPDGTRMVAGYSEVTATVDLGGVPGNSAQDGSWLWSPTSTGSPYYAKKRIGAPMQIKTGFQTSAGAELLTRFTGYVRSLDTDGAARTAELQSIDGSSRLRSQVLLPMATNLGNPGLTSRYFIDYILTQNGLDPDDQDLEDSLNPITSTPYTSDKQDSWTLIQQIAAAEYATAFFDETGKFHFWNRNHFGTAQSVNYTAKTVTVNGVTSDIPQVTSTKALKSLTTTEALDTIINHVEVNYTPYVVQPGDFIWSENSGRGLHSGQTISITANFDNPVQSLSSSVVVMPIGGSTGGKSAYRACTTPDGASGDPVENLTFTVTAYAQSAKITIHNPNKRPVYLVTPKFDSAGHAYPDSSVGQPALWLYGRAVTQDASFTSTTDGSTGAMQEALDQSSINDNGEIVFTVDGGNWIQDPDTAQALADELLALLMRPVPYFGDVDVVADPRLQLGDRIEVIDSTGSGLDEHAWIVAITDTFDGSGHAQTLTLRMCAAIGGWILGHPTRSALGSTTVLGGVY